MRCSLVIALGLATATAHADDTPWAQGVPEEQRDRANAAFAEGNELFSHGNHTAALEKYQAAIALWDHPMIRFNMAVDLIRLQRILEAADALDAALRYGSAPFTPELYQRALDDQSLVAGRVATIEGSCTQSGTQVSFDGKPWLPCPGTKKMRVLAGEHVVVGEQTGFMTQSRRVVLAGGSSTKVNVELVPIDAAVKLVYPSPRWAPWTVAAGGAAIAGGGFAFWLSAKNQMDSFERDFAHECPRGCDYRTMPLLANEHDGAILKSRVGDTMMIAGGAVVAGGLVWLLLNRPHRVMPEMEVAPGSGSVHVRVSF